MRVFVSSTFEDLKDHRKAVCTTVRRMQWEAVAMEDFGSRDDKPRTVCEDEIARCNFFVGIYAWRYGYQESTNAPSMIEMEFDCARRCGIPCLCYIVDDQHPWNPKWRDTEEAAKRLADFKKKVSDLLRSPFTTPENLAVQVAADLHREREKRIPETWLRVSQSEGYGASEVPHRPSTLVAPLSSDDALHLSPRDAAGDRGDGPEETTVAWRQIARAQELQRQGRTEEAVAQYHEAMVVDPGSFLARYNLGNLYARSGRNAEAEHEFRAALRTGGPVGYAHANLALVLGAQGKHDEAICHSREAVRLRPADAQVHYSLAVHLQEAGRDEEAAAEYGAAIEIRPDLVEALYNYATMLGRRGDHERAVELFDRAIERSPHFPRAHANRGISLMALGRVGESISALEYALRIDPTLEPARTSYAFALEKAELPEAAVVQWRRLVEEHPTAADYAIGLSRALRACGRQEDSFEVLRKATTHADDPHVLRTELGIWLAESTRLSEAISEFRAALAARPEPGSYLNLGRALEMKGEVDEAIRTYRRGLDAAPDSPALLSRLGAALAKRGATDEALALLTRCVEVSPQAADPHGHLGALLAKLGKKEEALDCFDKVLELNPARVQAVWLSSLLLCDLGRHSEAETRLRDLLRLHPDCHEAHSHLGAALEGLGRFAEAVDEYDAALKLDRGCVFSHVGLGRALMQLQEWRRAAGALEQALPLSAERRDVLTMLVEVYGELGMPEKADGCSKALRSLPDSAD